MLLYLFLPNMLEMLDNFQSFFNNCSLCSSNLFDLDDDSFASERDAQSTEDHLTTFVYNANHSLAIEAQRDRLPIRYYRDHILYCVEQYQTLVLVGETGCGKSTQVPQVNIQCYLNNTL